VTSRSLPLAIVGPTASGKTALATRLAKHLGGELVNADSRQLYRRLRVGTAAPSAAELDGVACHLLDLCEPGAPFSAAEWVGHAREVLAQLEARGVPAILVGGTGQYIRALRSGWAFGGAPPDVTERRQLTELSARPEGLRSMVEEVRLRDPAGAATVDLANPRRVIRALELLRSGARSLEEARRTSGGLDVDVVVLDVERRLHRATVERRVDAMFATGALIDEVTTELGRGTDAAALARSGIGYREALDLLDGSCTVDEASEATLRRTMRYAKAQRTWFRHEASRVRIDRGPDTSMDEVEERVLAAVRRWRRGPQRGSRR
jgi:tRNA dimethylallyltransferase